LNDLFDWALKELSELRVFSVRIHSRVKPCGKLYDLLMALDIEVRVKEELP